MLRRDRQRKREREKREEKRRERGETEEKRDRDREGGVESEGKRKNARKRKVYRENTRTSELIRVKKSFISPQELHIEKSMNSSYRNKFGLSGMSR